MKKDEKGLDTNNFIKDKTKYLYTFPIIIYIDLDNNKKSIIKNNKGKAGVYRWINKITGKSYIGSSINLGNRLRDYFNYSFLILPKNKNMLIFKSLLKYGYCNFELEILEYCLKEKTREREQYYLDLIKPEYNILNLTNSSLGFKHSKESLLKLKAHLNVLNEKKGNLVEGNWPSK